MKKLRAFDLFSGVGGFRSGIDSACRGLSLKIDWVGWCDFDKYAQKTYRACFNVSKEQFFSDITDITGKLSSKTRSSKLKLNKIDETIDDFDILTAGFPCQAFSQLGKRKGVQDERGALFYGIKLILMAKKPDFFILENVSGIKSIDKGRTFEKICSILKNDLKYNLAVWTINAKDYGVPQNRKRVFFVGSKDDIGLSDDDAPAKTSRRKFKIAKDVLDLKVDEKYYLSEKVKKTIIDPFPGFNDNPKYNLEIARCLTRTMHKMHRCSQDNYYSDDYITGVNSPKRRNRIRKITPKEGFRLQGFNENYIKKALNSGNSDTQLYMQIGNSVPVTMVSSIFKKLIKSTKYKI